MCAARSERVHPAALCIVGAGPPGTSVLLERSLVDVPPPMLRRGLDVHLVDPFPRGAGRVWRAAQSPLLGMHSGTQDVAIVPDAVSDLAGPLQTGPALWEWIRDVAHAPDLPPELSAEVARACPSWFPSRLLQSRYLEWSMDWLVPESSPGVVVHLHGSGAVDILDRGGRHASRCGVDRPTTPAPPSGQVVLLDDGSRLHVDAIVLALGHLDAAPREDELLMRAKALGLVMVPPRNAADARRRRLDGAGYHGVPGSPGRLVAQPVQLLCQRTAPSAERAAGRGGSIRGPEVSRTGGAGRALRRVQGQHPCAAGRHGPRRGPAAGQAAESECRARLGPFGPPPDSARSVRRGHRRPRPLAVGLSIGRVRVGGALRLVETNGRTHPPRFAVGPWASAAGFTAAFARPRASAGFLRRNDALARTVLHCLLDPAQPVEVSGEAASADPEGVVA